MPMNSSFATSLTTITTTMLVVATILTHMPTAVVAPPGLRAATSVSQLLFVRCVARPSFKAAFSATAAVIPKQQHTENGLSSAGAALMGKLAPAAGGLSSPVEVRSGSSNNSHSIVAGMAKAAADQKLTPGADEDLIEASLRSSVVAGQSEVPLELGAEQLNDFFTTLVSLTEWGGKCQLSRASEWGRAADLAQFVANGFRELPAEEIEGNIRELANNLAECFLSDVAYLEKGDDQAEEAGGSANSQQHLPIPPSQIVNYLKTKKQCTLLAELAQNKEASSTKQALAKNFSGTITI